MAGHNAAVDVARKRAGALPIVVVEGDLTRAAISAGVDQVAGAVAATEHLIGLGHRRMHTSRSAPLVRGPGPAGGVAVGHGAQRPARGPPPSGRLEPRIRLHRWTADRSRCRDHGGLRQQRPDGPWRTASPPGGQAASPAMSPSSASTTSPEAAYLFPPLTTVHQDFAAVGHQAIAVLAAALSGAELPTPGLLSAPLIERASTAPPRKDR